MKKILVLEDDVLLLKILEVLFPLEKDIQLIVAVSHEESVNKLKDDKPDLILVSLSMRGISGLDIIKDIRRDPLLSGIPVIAMDIVGKGEALDEAVRVGATEGVMKGMVSLEDFGNRIRHFIS